MVLVAEKTPDKTDFVRSVTGKIWTLRSCDERQATSLAQKFDLPEIVARILSSRGITSEIAEDFLSPSLRSSLPDPCHLIDMEKAAQRLAQAILSQENVVIFGDYDVDGATSSAILKRFFKMAGLETKIYIPDRVEEGYGPNIPALKKLREEGADIIITVDCGTVSFEPLEKAKSFGLETIVIDHHLGAETMPEAIAVVNPNRIDETSPHRNLAACGISFLLVVAINRILREKNFYNQRSEPDIFSLLDLVALGTVCDVMSLTGLNRAYVNQGLKVMAARRNLGLTVLADIARLEGTPSTYHAGFLLGPRINAGGRIGEAGLGARLLTTDDPDEAREIALKLDRLNEERRAIEITVMDEAIMQAENLSQTSPVIIVAGEGWHQGVIGIVAGRIKEKFGRPAAVIALDGELGKASARSITGVDFGAAVAAARSKGLLIAGGGHAMAAGFTVEKAKIQELQNFLNERLGPAIEEFSSQKKLIIETILSPSGVNPDLAESISFLEPFGVGNPEPRIAIKNARLLKSEQVGIDHISCIIGQGGAFADPKIKLKAIAFRSLGTPLGKALITSQGKDIHLAGKIKLNHWQGKSRAEFHIEDVVI